jgi:hypothetical protein
MPSGSNAQQTRPPDIRKQMHVILYNSSWAKSAMQAWEGVTKPKNVSMGGRKKSSEFEFENIALLSHDRVWHVGRVGIC